LRGGTPSGGGGSTRVRRAMGGGGAAGRGVEGRRPPPHYGQTLDAGRRDLANAQSQLIGLAGDAQAPAIARATAVSLLRPRSVASIRALERAPTDPNPLVPLRPPPPPHSPALHP